MSDINFPKGFMFKLPPDKAPDFVKGKVSIRFDEFCEWVTDNCNGEEWINFDLKVSKEGKGYAQLNTWKKEEKTETKKEPEKKSKENTSDSLPF